MEKIQLTTNTLRANESVDPSIQLSNDKEPIPTTIYDLPVEILLIIFQETIENEAFGIRESFPWPHKLEATFNLALVNKQWRDITNEASSLWRVFWFDLSKPIDPVQKKLDRLLSLSKNTPIDLLLTTIHSRENIEFHTVENCVCSSSFFTSLPRITNLRSLSLEILENDGKIPLTLDLLPSLTNVRYFHFNSYGKSKGFLDASAFLPLMPELLELKLRCPLVQRKLDRFENGNILLPCLRWLDVGPYGGSTLHEFASLLRHCRNIEYLCLNNQVNKWGESPTQFETITLSSLQTLHITELAFLPHLFSPEWICTPNLMEVVTNDIHPTPYRYWRSLFQRNPNITKLTIPARSGIARLLCEAPSIQHLTLMAEESIEDDWLRRLADIEVESYLRDFKSSICPELRTLTILLGPTAPSPSAFESFTQSRCIPVNGERYTMTGYKALELLSLRVSLQDALAIDMLQRTPWGNAEAEKSIVGENFEFSLRWSLVRVGVPD